MYSLWFSGHSITCSFYSQIRYFLLFYYKKKKNTHIHRHGHRSDRSNIEHSHSTLIHIRQAELHSKSIILASSSDSSDIDGGDNIAPPTKRQRTGNHINLRSNNSNTNSNSSNHHRSSHNHHQSAAVLAATSSSSSNSHSVAQVLLNTSSNSSSMQTLNGATHSNGNTADLLAASSASSSQMMSGSEIGGSISSSDGARGLSSSSVSVELVTTSSNLASHLNHSMNEMQAHLLNTSTSNNSNSTSNLFTLGIIGTKCISLLRLFRRIRLRNQLIF